MHPNTAKFSPPFSGRGGGSQRRTAKFSPPFLRNREVCPTFFEGGILRNDRLARLCDRSGRSATFACTLMSTLLHAADHALCVRQMRNGQ